MSWDYYSERADEVKTVAEMKALLDEMHEDEEQDKYACEDIAFYLRGKLGLLK